MELLLDAEKSIELLINREGLIIPEELLSHSKVFVVFLNLYKAAMLARAGGVSSIPSPLSQNWEMESTRIYQSRQASYRFQAVIQKAEAVLVIVSKKMRGLFKTQFGLGTGLEVAIGPLAKKIGLNLQKLLFKKYIYAYSTIKDLFVGISLKGVVITSDSKANRKLPAKG